MLSSSDCLVIERPISRVGLLFVGPIHIPESDGVEVHFGGWSGKRGERRAAVELSLEFRSDLYVAIQSNEFGTRSDFRAGSPANL